MKTKVTAWMVARVPVEMEVEYEDGTTRVNLTDDELELAQDAAAAFNLSPMDWDVERVTRG